MNDQDDRKRREQVTRNQPVPDMDAQGGGPVTPGRAGQGMGVPTGDYTDAPPAATGAGAAPPTPKADAGKRPRNAGEGKPG